MSETKERREGMRISLNITMGFNIIKTADEFDRTMPPGSSLFTKLESIHELSENNPIETMILQLDKKLSYVIDLLTEKIGGKDYEYKSRIRDLSESGLKIISTTPPDTGAYLEMGLRLPNEPHRTLDILGKVLSSHALKDDQSKPAKYEISISFEDVLAEDQDNIVHYIFQKQREEIRSQKGFQ